MNKTLIVALFLLKKKKKRPFPLYSILSFFRYKSQQNGLNQFKRCHERSPHEKILCISSTCTRTRIFLFSIFFFLKKCLVITAVLARPGDEATLIDTEKAIDTKADAMTTIEKDLKEIAKITMIGVRMTIRDKALMKEDQRT